nr:MAG TPA: hypothetical protein [Bacteriophage sp.]
MHKEEVYVLVISIHYMLLPRFPFQYFHHYYQVPIGNYIHIHLQNNYLFPSKYSYDM